MRLLHGTRAPATRNSRPGRRAEGAVYFALEGGPTQEVQQVAVGDNERALSRD